MRNADVEKLWIDAWNELYEIIQDREDFPCVLPDYSCVSATQCRAWLQDSVYGGFAVKVSRGFHEGRPAAVVTRSLLHAV